MTCLIHFLVMKLNNLRCCRLLNESFIVCRAEITTPLGTFQYLFGVLCMQESLAQMRAIDDRIIYKLNTSIPTQSFSGQVSAATQCKQLYDEVSRMWSMLDASALRPSKACTYLGVVGLAGVCSTLVHWCKLMNTMWACKESCYSECCVGMLLAPLYCM